jgi:hypothetical protein
MKGCYNELANFLKSLRKDFVVLSSTSYLRNSKLKELDNFLSGLAIETKSDINRYTLDCLLKEKRRNLILVSLFRTQFINFIFTNCEKIKNIFDSIILLEVDESFVERYFIFFPKSTYKLIFKPREVDVGLFNILQEEQ